MTKYYDRTDFFNVQTKQYTHTPFTEFISYQDFGSFGMRKAKQGVDNPLWRFYVENHVSAGTNFSAVLEEVDYQHTKIVSNYHPEVFGGPQNSWADCTWEGVIIDPADSVGGTVDDFVTTTRCQNLALQRIYGEIRSARSSFSGATFLAELQEALHGIRHPLVSLRRSLDSYASRAYKRVRSVKGFPRGGGVVPPSARRRVAKTLQDTWLEYSLGIMPTVRDIQAGYDTLRKKTAAFQSGDTIPVRGQAAEQYVRAVPSSGVVINHDFYGYTRTVRGYVSVRYEGAVWGYPYGRPLDDATLWGLDRTTFFPTLWEIMPYSFLIDYFTNVGDVIDAWSLGAVKMAWSQMTTRKERFYIRSNWRAFTKDPWTSQSEITQGQFTVHKKTVDRAQLGTQLDFPVVQFKLPTHVGQALNLSALFNLQGVKAKKFPAY